MTVVGQQLAFTVVPAEAAGVTEIITANLGLIGQALDDAAAWREHMDDEPGATVYQELAGAIEAAEEGW